jgi:hypothetical protein
MRKGFVILLCTTAGLNLYSQDTVWKQIKIDENLVVALPGKISQIDTFGIKGNMKLDLRVFKTETQTSTIAVVITPKESNINVVDKESLKEALDGIAKGLCNSATKRGLSCVVSDTTIDELPCKKSKFFSSQNAFEQKVNYTFLAGDKMYTFTIADVDSNEIYRNYSRLLSSVHFTSFAKGFRVSSIENSSAGGWGYMIGKISILLLIAGIIVYFVKK